jgi:hypothetical protein
MRALVRFVRVLPLALERLHLEWALREVSPLHPDVPLIVRRLSEIKESR